jgi:hypothetical protein
MTENAMRSLRLAALAALVLGSTMVACGGGSSGGGSQPALPSVSLQASPATVAVGTASTLAWSSTNASACTASGAWSGSRSLRGTESTPTLTTSQVFTLTCEGPGGTASQTVTVAVDQATPPPAVTLTADRDIIPPGDSATLSWATTNATTCTATGSWSGTRPVSGSESTGALTEDASYTLECAGAGGSSSSTLVIQVQPADSTSIFPLRVSANGRYLEDRTGKPFLLHGDSPWSLVVQLSREDVELYLQDRRARGFNTLLMNLIEHNFSDNPPHNWYGDAPFLTPGDFSTPNEAYFAHADWVLQRAGDLGFTVFLTPAYLGYGGGDEGWYEELVASTAEVRREYGRFLGARYQHMEHIIWTHGGDYNPPNRDVVLDVAEGIREFTPGRLETAHCVRETAAVEYWPEPWLTLNNVYTGRAVYSDALDQYNRPGPLAFFFLEGLYENEHSITTVRIRTQAYHALLSGAAGQLFGNNPIWHFDGPGLYPAPVTWKEALDGPGSRSMAIVWNLFSSLQWWLLVPDVDNQVLVGGLGDGQDRAVAAQTGDRGLAVAYVPTVRDIQMDFSTFSGPQVAAEWHDPSSGAVTTAAGSPLAADGLQTLRPPGANDAGDPDWVLVLRSIE